ncbi:MAG: T9SS type A sorting domain-containing protein, partial [Bacteroidia bacterium]|nr:T9SS type A sorting domain-containing protein [Bacteroidia bacterium]
SSTVVHAVTSTPVINAGAMESFESSFPMPGWSLPNNTTPAQNWKQNSIAASHGMQSMYIQGEVMPIGKVAVLQTPAYDFQNNPGAGFSFKYAYARKTSSTSDRLRILASKDCGGSWKQIWSATAAMLSNGSGGIQNNIFIPNANQWKLFQLDLHPQFAEFLTEPRVMIQFEFTEDTLMGFQNRFYLDEINFSTPLGLLKNHHLQYLHAYPNPASDEIHLSFFPTQNENAFIKITDPAGRVIYSESVALNSSEKFTATLNLCTLASGIYFLQVEGEKSRALLKFIKK